MRQNKAMPESPAIVAKVTKALHSGRRTELTIPWSDFVFSTREGKTFMPPTLAKGIAILKKTRRPLAGPEGVRLNVVPAERGSFAPDTFLLQSSLREGTLRHETLHFVQTVGDNLIRLTKGDPTAFAKFGVLDRLHKAVGPGAKKRDLELAMLQGVGSGLYGGPKRRSATMGKGISSRSKYAKDRPVHALADIEFQTDTLSLAVKTAALPEMSKATPAELALKISINALYNYTHRMKPQRRQDFTRVAFQRAAEMLGISSELTPSVKKALGEEAGKPRRKVATASPSPTPARTKPAAPARKRTLPFPPPPPTPARRRPTPPPKKRTQAPAVRSTALRVVETTMNGRKVYAVYRGDEPTGKYGFSEAKANEIMGRMRA